MLEDYTQSILMQLALARKDELFNGSIIASSSFYTGSFQGCNYFHTWFNTWHHWHKHYAHIRKRSCRHIHTHMEARRPTIHHTIMQFYLIIQARKVKLPRIRFDQWWHSRRIPKQQTQMHRVWRLMGWLQMSHPEGGQLCLPAFLPSHLAALY